MGLANTATMSNPLRPYVGPALALLACWTLLAARILWSGSLTYLPLAWNLVLAGAPLALVPAVTRALRGNRPVLALIPGSLWMLFLPNAPYLVSDLVHLESRAPVPYWYDIGMLGFIAITGFLLGLRSMELIHAAVEGRLGRAAGWGVSAGAALACGPAILLGRYGRWNSWDMVSRPAAVVEDAVERLAEGRGLGMSLLYGLGTLTLYLAFQRREPARAGIHAS